MDRPALLKDLRRLRHWNLQEASSDQFTQHKHEILEELESLGLSYELWDILIAHHGLPLNHWCNRRLTTLD